jgi:diacylglycerol kinase family enzyme
MPPDADQVLLSVNPKAGRRPASRRVDDLEGLLRERGFGVEIFTDLGEVSARANQLHGEGRLRALVGVGGDGTAAELVNRTAAGVPVTLLAAGTANLLSRQLRLGAKPRRLADTIAAGHLLRFDAGKAGQRLFLVMVSCGFDADVVDRVQKLRETNRRGGHIGYSSYLKPIVQSIRNYRYPEIRVNLDEAEAAAGSEPPDPLVARWAFACNFPRYGWGIPIAPGAVPTDGRLDLCTFRRGSLWHGFRYAAAAQFAWHPRLKDCEIRQGRRFRLSSDEPVAYQTDGDPGGWLPLEVEVLPGRVTMVVAPEVARRL